MELFLKNKATLLYGIFLALLLLLLKWLEIQFMIIRPSSELYIGSIALFFTAFGIWTALKLTKPKTEIIVVEKEVIVPQKNFLLNEKELQKRGISKRELDVLQLIAEGLSNKEIALRLFVSENTIKSHLSKLFEKLEVERRTQAIEKSKRLNIIP